MWETYVEPNIRKQEAAGAPGAGRSAGDSLEGTIAAAVTAGLQFGVDPAEIEAAVRKSWNPKGA
jgi:hypothetical protein